MSEIDLRQPVFVVAAPRSGDGLLLEALSRATGVWTARTGGASFLDDVPELQAERREFESHRATADDAQALAEPARAGLVASLRDREGRPTAEGAEGEIHAVASGPRLALRIPFLDAVFPDARFVFVFREPADSLPEMLAAWESEQFVSVPDLPGWPGTPWSLPLVPGWRELAGQPLEDVVAQQWRVIVDTALADLERLGPDRWAVADHAALLENPRRELRRLCSFLGIPYDQALLDPVERARRAIEDRQPTPTAELRAVLPRVEGSAARARELLAAPPEGAAGSGGRPGASAFRSVSTGSFPKLLRRAGGSLLVSTYQTGKLVCAREQRGLLNTHFRDFDKPMGLTVADGRFALGTRTEVWDFRNMPEVAPKVEPAGTHDACYLPRNRHVTGDILIHEMAYASGELWVVATAFSCLATLDSDHSFVPRWVPPWISAVQPGDRCHLNGMAVIDDRVAYVSSLARTDEPGTWRQHKAEGGVIVDVESSEVVVEGLSMPHSPRWHDGRLWVLESGRGELCVVDLEAGTREPVAELPGFTRGLAFAGRTAFVGLSQIRESSTFGDLPLTQRLDERVCGVWAVDLETGKISGFLRFEDLVQEIFDVALLPGARFPEIAEPGSSAVSTSYVLP